MKKLLMLILVIMLAVSFTVISFGCKEEIAPAEEEIAPAEEEIAPAEEVTEEAAEAKPEFVNVQGYDVKVPWDKDPKDIEIVNLYLNITHEFASKLERGVLAAAEEWGVNAYQTGSDNWGSEDQVKIFEQLIDKVPDGINVCIADPPAINPLVQQALAKGIPVATYNVDSPESGRFAYSGEDLFLAGVATAEALMAMLEEKGVVDDPSKSRSGDHIKVVVTDVAPELFADQERYRGIESVMEKYEGLELIGPVPALGGEEEIYAVVENTYASHSDMDGVISNGGPTAVFWGKFFKANDIGNNLGDDPIYGIGHGGA